jgi:anaerobic magnesium-protoporphyrin IX monomethyl ester cyclase
LRFEKGLIDKKVWKNAVNSECKFPHFGFESGSERVLEFMNKTTTLDTMRRTLQLSSETGIWNHVMVFLAFRERLMKMLKTQ